MNKTDILIENTINDYLIKEGFKDWFSRKPKIKLTRADGDYLYGTVGRTEEEIPIFLSFKNGKVKKLKGQINGDWKPIKIANMPREGEVVYCGIWVKQNKTKDTLKLVPKDDLVSTSPIYYGFDNKFNQICFINYNGTFYKVYKEDNQWLPYNDGEISKVYFFNEDSNYQQDDSPINFEFGKTENGSETGVSRVSSNDDAENYGEYDGNTNDGAEDYGEEDGNTNDDVENYGEYDGNTNDDAEYRASILNPQEEYPLSNALLRLVRQRELRNSRRARNLMRDLIEIGY